MLFTASALRMKRAGAVESLSFPGLGTLNFPQQSLNKIGRPTGDVGTEGRSQRRGELTCLERFNSWTTARLSRAPAATCVRAPVRRAAGAQAPAGRWAGPHPVTSQSLLRMHSERHFSLGFLRYLSIPGSGRTTNQRSVVRQGPGMERPRSGAWPSPADRRVEPGYCTRRRTVRVPPGTGWGDT